MHGVALQKGENCGAFCYISLNQLHVYGELLLHTMWQALKPLHSTWFSLCKLLHPGLLHNWPETTIIH